MVTINLILLGATNVDKALEVNCRVQRHTVTATLLIIKAAIEDDQNLVLKLYGEDIQGLLQTKVPLKEKDNFTEVQHCVLNGHVNLSFAMEIAQKNNSFAVRELLLLRTGINRCKRVVSWSGLHLTQVEISLLEKILWIKDLLLSDNKLIFFTTKNWWVFETLQ